MKKLNEYEISFYKNVRDKKGCKVNLYEVIKDIKKGKYKKEIDVLRKEKDKKVRNQLKSNLPAFTVSGVFESNKRKAEFVTTYTGLIQIDFDDVSNLDDTLTLLKADTYTYIAFLSPSGTGIKLIIRVPVIKRNHLSVFESLSEYYKNTFNLMLDKSCKDISRLFFISYDENLFINEKSKVYTLDTQKVNPKKTSNTKSLPISNPNVSCFKTSRINSKNTTNIKTSKTLDNTELYKNKTPVTQDVTGVKNDIEIVIQRTIDSKTDLTQGYDNWLKIGFVLSNVFGEDGRNHYHNLSCINPSYDFYECDRQFTNCLKSNNQGVTAKTFFHIAKENGVNISISKQKTHIKKEVKKTNEVQYLKEDFEKNGFWEENGHYYSKGAKGAIKRISKFKLEALYLFKDGTNNAMRLMKITNTQNGEMLLEIPAKDLTSIQSFKTAVKSQGNFTFLGNSTDLDNLTDVLCQKEVDALKIQTLGYLKKDFNCYAFSNGVIDENNQFIPTDDYGVIKIKGANLYSPANSILHKENHTFTSEKVFQFKVGVLTFYQWSNLFIKAYGNKGLIGMAFFVSALYRDLIFEYKGHYPFLFLFGERQTGKTTFAECLLYPFTSEPEKWAIALTNSTHKSLERKNSKAKNAIFYHKEYNKNTLDKHIIAYYKSAFDGSGGEKAQFSNDNKTHQTPVESAFIIDGNYLPTQESALMDRMIILYFYNNSFNEETKQAIKQLISELKKGGGQIIQEVLKHRTNVQKNIKHKFDYVYNELKKNNIISERTADNLASFGAPILSSDFLRKEKQNELIEELLKIGIEQEKNLNFVDEINRFWKAVVYYKETTHTENLLANGLYFNQNIIGIRLSLFYPLYVKYMEENKLNDSILEEMALKKQITQENYNGLLDKSRVVKIRNKSTRYAMFKKSVIDNLDD